MTIVARRGAQVGKRVPELLHDHQQLLGVNVLRARLRGCARENILQLLAMIASPHRALHNVAKRLERVGLESWRLRPIEGHHNGSTNLCEVSAMSESSALNLTPDFRPVKHDGVSFAEQRRRLPHLSMPAPHRAHRSSSRQQAILIFSHDAVAAALLAGLVETLGYEIHFAHPPESAEDSVRRVRPRICLLDCDDPLSWRSEFFGRATMRGVSVIIYGTQEALDRVRAIASDYDLDTLLMPPTIGALELVLQRAGDK